MTVGAVHDVHNGGNVGSRCGPDVNFVHWRPLKIFSLRLPGDQNFSTGCNITRDEALGAGGKELVALASSQKPVKAASTVLPSAAFSRRTPIPAVPLATIKPRDSSERRMVL